MNSQQNPSQDLTQLTQSFIALSSYFSMLFDVDGKPDPAPSDYNRVGFLISGAEHLIECAESLLTEQQKKDLVFMRKQKLGNQLPPNRDAIILPLQAAKQTADSLSQSFYDVAHKDTTSEGALVLAKSYEEISQQIQQGLIALNILAIFTGNKKAD